MNHPRPIPPARRVRPATDVFETETSLVLVADLPGAGPEALELQLVDDVLHLRARTSAAPPPGTRPLGAEFELCDYERSFRLTAEVERERIEAVLRNGRLCVLLPKRPRPGIRIPVQG